MKNKGFNKKKIKYRRRPANPLRTLKDNESVPVLYRVLVSCATDTGPKETNQDYYGVRVGNEIITFDQFRTSFEKEFSDVQDLVAAVADGVSMASHPDDPEEDAQAIAVNHLLGCMYYQFNMGGQEDLIADELNEIVVEQSEKYHGQLASTISAIGIAGCTVRIMYMGDSPVLHMHGGILNSITPSKNSNYLDEYLGNPAVSGTKMAVNKTVPVKAGDTWIIASDGALEALTHPDGSVDSDLICEIIKNHPDHIADEIVRISGEKMVPGINRKCADNRTAVVIRILEVKYGKA